MHIENFNKENNYIGCSERQHRWTNFIFKLFPDINWTAYKHDTHYRFMLAERNSITRLVVKIMYDLMFLLVGSVRLIKNFRFDGLLWIVLLYLILLISTPVMLIIWRKKKVNL